MNFDKYTYLANSAFDKAKDIANDVREGIKLSDRYVITRNVRTKIVVTDTATGKKLVDTEDSYTRSYSLLKLLFSAAALFVSAVVCIVSLKRAIKQKKQLKEQKKELHRIKKLCKKADIELSEE